jgi:RimJ/RimL family protein N-acetyltransferase
MDSHDKYLLPEREVLHRFFILIAYYANRMKPDILPTIAGDKVCLRALGKKDIKPITKWHNDPEIMRLMAITRPTLEGYWLNWFDRITNSPNVVYFGIVKKDDSRLIGYVHLEDIMWHHKLCRDTGMAIGEKEEWSKGYGTEAMKLLIDYALSELGLHRLELMTFAFNERAQRVWEKCGFEKEGVMRKARLVNGEWHDVIFLAILKDE